MKRVFLAMLLVGFASSLMLLNGCAHSDASQTSMKSEGSMQAQTEKKMKEDASMKKEGDTMMKEDTSMKKEGDTMMKEEAPMKKE